MTRRLAARAEVTALCRLRLVARAQFSTCEKRDTAVAYMWTWTKDSEVALFVRKK